MSAQSYRGQTEDYTVSPDGRVRITIAVRLKPDELDRGRAIMAGKVRKSQEDPGCALYDAWTVPGKPTEMLFLVEFESLEALRAHEQSEHAQAFYALLPEILAEPVEKTFWYGPSG